MINQDYIENFNNLTLVIPAKEKTDCLLHVLKELKNFKVKKIVVLPKEDVLPSDWRFEEMKIINQKNSGYGNALIEGINNVKTDFFCIFNADGSFDPSELYQMMLLTKKFDFIFGSRYLKNAKSDDDTIITFLGNFIFSLIGKIFFNVKISDILYTYVLCSTKKTKELKIQSGDFVFCVELPIKVQRKKFNYTEIASHERRRISGIKNVNEFVDGTKILIKLIYFFFQRKI
jgi:glycosyltransferase involved in cell wall biosynthesis